MITVRGSEDLTKPIEDLQDVSYVSTLSTVGFLATIEAILNGAHLSEATCL